MFIKISQNLQDNTCARVSFLIKSQTGNFIKNEALIHFFPEYYEFFLNITYLTEHLRTATSESLTVKGKTTFELITLKKQCKVIPVHNLSVA